MPAAVPFIMLGISAIGTAYAIKGQQVAGKQAEVNANFQADQAAADARAEQGAAAIEGERIRRAGKRQQSEARASAAASGVDIDSPTSVKIGEEINRNAETDAYMTILGGGDRAARLNQGGAAARLEGKSARDAANLQSVGSLVSFGVAATNNGQGWKKAPKKTGTGG